MAEYLFIVNAAPRTATRYLPGQPHQGRAVARPWASASPSLLKSSQNRDVHLIVKGVQRLDGQGQVAGCFQELRQCHVELVQARKSGGEPFEDDGRLLAAYVNPHVRIRGVERAAGSRRAEIGRASCRGR